MSMSKPKPNPQFNVLQKENAAIAREQYDDFMNRFAPIQDELNEQAGGNYNIGADVAQAAVDVDQSYQTADQMNQRDQRRYGVRLDPQQQKFLAKQKNLDRSLAMVGAKNKAIETNANRSDGLLQQMMNINRGQAGEALGEFASAAQMEGQSGIADMNRRTAKYQSNMQTAGNIASTVAMAMIMSSSKDKKKNIKGADSKKALKEVDSMDIKNYQYKDGEGPSGNRTGVIAEEAPEGITALNRKAVNIGDWTAKNTAAIQEIGKQVKSIDKKIKSLNRSKS